MSQVEASPRTLFGKIFASIFKPFPSATVLSVEYTRHRGLAQPALSANAAAVDKISSVNATLEGKAPGRTRTVKSNIGGWGLKDVRIDTAILSQIAV